MKIIIEQEFDVVDNMDEIKEINEEIEKDKKIKESRNKKILSNITTVCITVVVVSLIMTFLGQFVYISGESMMPTYKDGNVVFVEKISDSFDRFDVVTVTPDSLNHIIVKRIIGIPGDTIQIIDGHVYINNEKLQDVIDTKIEDAGLASSPITLKENEYFVLGDNRNCSYDSRFEDIGVISSDDVFGKVLFTFS
jgi:signal peptidase I